MTDEGDSKASHTSSTSQLDLKTRTLNGYWCLKLKLFLIYAGIVVFSFLMIFLPWIYLTYRDWNRSNGHNYVWQVIHRMFPFKRGLFEDKVSNFWCATNLIIK